MRVLLTGSSGWLGRHLAPLLASRGHDVTGLDVAPGAHTRVLGSVANRSLVFQTVAHYGIEAVIHAGALHKPDIVRFPRQAFIDTNVTGTLNLLEAAALEGHARFLFTSTTSLMVRADVRAGAGDKGAWWMDEAFGPLEPRNIYGATKLAAENLCRVVSQGSGMAAAIFCTMASGVPVGAKIACHEVTSKSPRPLMPDSATVGTSLSASSRCLEVTASARSFPLWICGAATTVVSNIMSTCPPITS